MRNGTIATRLVSILLSAAMTATLLPTGTMSVYANEVETEVVVDKSNEELEEVEETDSTSNETETKNETETEIVTENSTDEALMVLEDHTNIYEQNGSSVAIDISSAESLEAGKKLSLGNMLKGEKKWLEFTAPKDGFYMFKTEGNTAGTFNCSYYIGAKDAKSTALLDFCRTDQNNVIDYANFLDQDETVYILLEATAADISFETHPIYVSSAVKFDQNGVESVLPQSAGTDFTKRYFYYTAKQNLPFLAFETAYDSANKYVWTLYSLDDVRYTQKFNNLTKLNASESTRYMSYPLGNVKEGESYLIELSNQKSEDTNVKLKAIETIGSVNVGSRVKLDDMSSAQYYTVNITETGYYYLSNSFIGTGSVGDVEANLYSEFENQKADAIYLKKTNESISHGKLFEKRVENSTAVYGVSRVFKALDGAAKLTPGTYYLEFRNNTRNDNGLQNEVKDFTFILDKVTTISEKKNFGVTLQADTPAVFEYAHTIMDSKSFDVETKGAVSEIVEIEMKDVSGKKNGSKLEAIERSGSGEAYNAFEVVGVASATEATIKCEREVAVLKDLTSEITSSDKIDGADITKRFEADVTYFGKKFTFSFAPKLTPEGVYTIDGKRVQKPQENSILFSMNASGAGVDDNFKKNHFVRVELYDDQNVMKNYKDLKLDSTDAYAKIDKLEELTTYKIKATLYKKTNTAETLLADLITDNNAKDESGNAFNEMRTLGIRLIPETGDGFVVSQGHTYVKLKFQYLDSAVKSVILKEDGAEKYTISFQVDPANFASSGTGQVLTVHSNNIKPGTKYHMLFLKKYYFGKMYYSDEDIVKPQDEKGNLIKEDLCFTTKSYEETATVEKSTVSYDAITLKVDLGGLDILYSDRDYRFNYNQLELTGKLNGETVEIKRSKSFVNRDNNGKYEGVVTAYYTIDGLNEGTNYNITDLKLTYFGKSIELTTDKFENVETPIEGKVEVEYTGASVFEISNVRLNRDENGNNTISFDISDNDGGKSIEAWKKNQYSKVKIYETNAKGSPLYSNAFQGEGCNFSTSIPLNSGYKVGNAYILNIELYDDENLDEQDKPIYNYKTQARVSNILYTENGQSSTPKYNFEISQENISDFRAQMHVKVTAEGGGTLDPDDYKLKMILKAWIEDEKKTIDLNGDTGYKIETDVDTAKFIALSPDEENTLIITLVKKGKGGAADEEIDEKEYTFTTKKADFAENFQLDSVGNASAVFKGDLTNHKDVMELLKAGKFNENFYICFKVKETKGQSQPTGIGEVNYHSTVDYTIPGFGTDYTKPFEVIVSDLKPNTSYEFYVANNSDEKHYCTIPFTTLNEEMKIVPVVDAGFDKVSFKASIEGRSETDLRYYGWDLYYRKSGSGGWTGVRKGPAGNDPKMPPVEASLEGLSECTEYDYVLMVNNDTPIDANELDQNLEYLKAIYKDDEHVLVAKKGFKTKNRAEYELDSSIKVPGELPVTFWYDKNDENNTTNTIKLKLSVPEGEKTIKAVAKIAEMDDKGGFQEYSEGNQLKSEEAYLTSEDGFEGEFTFKNLEKNVSYYLKEIDVYVNELSTDTDYKAPIHIHFAEPTKSLMFISGTNEALMNFMVAGLEDLQKTDLGEMRGYNSLQTDSSSNTYIVAYEKKGDKYELKLTNGNGKNIGNVSSVFDLKVENPKIAKITVSEDGSNKIELLRTGETKLTITPKQTGRYNHCQAKEIILKVKRTPNIPDTADIYALTNVQKKLSDIKLESYGFGSEWEWSNPNITLTASHSEIRTRDGNAVSYGIRITDAASEIYYPLEITRKVKPREFKSLNIYFYDGKRTWDSAENKKVEYSADGKTAVVPVWDGADSEKCAPVIVDADYYGRGIYDDGCYTYYEWEELPDDVTRKDTGYANIPSGLESLFYTTKVHNDGLKLKLKGLYFGHKSGETFVKDVDLLSEKLITQEELENAAITLYATNTPIVSKINIIAEETSISTAKNKNVAGCSLDFNAKDFGGDTMLLKPLFYDNSNTKLSGVSYSFESSDVEIASVASEPDAEGRYAVDIKKKVGSAVLTVKVNNGIIEKKAEVIVRVVDYTPKVSTKTVTVNTAYDFDSTEGKELAKKTDTPIEILPVYGSEITSVELADSCEQDSNGNITYTKSSEVDCFKDDSTNQYFVMPKTELKKAKTYMMIVKVGRGTSKALSNVSITYAFPIKVTPKKTAVKASVKTVEYYNTFYKDAKGKLALTLNNDALAYAGSELTWKDAADSTEGGTFQIAIDTTDGKKVVEKNEKKGTYTYSLSFTADKLEVVNKKLANNKAASGELTLKLKGYKEPVTLKVKLPVRYKKPNLKIYTEAIIPDIGTDRGRFIILDENQNIYGYKERIGQDIENAVSYHEMISKNSAFDVTYNSDVEKVYFTKGGKDIDWTITKTGQGYTYKGKKKSDSTKLTLRADNWRETLEVTLKFTTKTAYSKLENGADKITFNTAFASKYVSYLDTNLSSDYLKIGDMTEEDYVITSSNGEAAKLLSSNLLKFKLCKDDEKGYYIQSSVEKLSEAMVGVKPGKYTYSITPRKTVVGKKKTLKPIKFIITITNKTPKIVYKERGKVDNLFKNLDDMDSALKNCKTVSQKISLLSKYAYTLKPQLVNYPSGSCVEGIDFGGEYMMNQDDAIFTTKDIKVDGRYEFTYLAENKNQYLMAGQSYRVEAYTRVRVGVDPANMQSEQTAHTCKVKIVQGKPKITVAKGSNGKPMYIGREENVKFELNIPAMYTISDACGELDINKDGIVDVEVKAAFHGGSADDGVDYLYGTLTSNNTKLHITKKRKVTVPVTLKMKGRDGITKDAVVKVSFWIVP